MAVARNCWTLNSTEKAQKVKQRVEWKIKYNFEIDCFHSNWSPFTAMEFHWSHGWKAKDCLSPLQVQHYENDGKCGVCGDSWGASDRPHEAPGGKFATGIIGRSYLAPGSVIDVAIDVVANHRSGH